MAQFAILQSTLYYLFVNEGNEGNGDHLLMLVIYVYQKQRRSRPQKLFSMRISSLLATVAKEGRFIGSWHQQSSIRSRRDLGTSSGTVGLAPFTILLYSVASKARSHALLLRLAEEPSWNVFLLDPSPPPQSPLGARDLTLDRIRTLSASTSPCSRDPNLPAVSSASASRVAIPSLATAAAASSMIVGSSGSLK
mmetsp:Transcript_11275/g.34396  ORF Transcript_11275/g.34396 Transcript_11275/m.34396 type:complete len:194 (-) Transcript_11275:935-1516(-)